jgi:hypothetical protein
MGGGWGGGGECMQGGVGVETVPVKHFMRLIVNELNAYDSTLCKGRIYQRICTE